MPGCTWWNGLWPPEHSHPGLSQVPGTGNWVGPALEGVQPWCFWGALWAAWLWRQGMGSTSQCVLLPEQPCEPRRTCHAWDQACTPGPNGQPHHGPLWELPFSVQLAGPTEGGSPLIPWAWPACTGYPVWAIEGYASCLYWLTLGGSITLIWPFPSVPSCSLAMTRLRTGSACWAWCQSCKVIHMTCWLSWTSSRMCRLQVWPSMGLMGPLRTTSCTTHTAVAVTLWWVHELSGMHPSQDTLDKASASMLAFLAR